MSPVSYAFEISKEYNSFVSDWDDPRLFTLKADSHIACCAHAVLLPCRVLIHTCHAAPLPCSDSALSFVKVWVVTGNIGTASPAV